MQLCKETWQMIEDMRKNREEYTDWKNRNYPEERHVFDKQALKVPCPEGMEFRQDVIADVSVEWMMINESRNLIFFVHGGGFVSGSVLSRRVAFARIAEKAGMNGISVDYSLAPEKPYPYGLLDCVRVYENLLKKGYESTKIHFFGESVGASLCLSIIHYLKDHNIDLPASVCVFSPVVDISIHLNERKERSRREIMLPLNMYEEIQNCYCQGQNWKNPYLSPIYGDMTGFPKILVQVGTEEMLLEDAEELWKKSIQAGVDCRLKVWDGLFHSFLVFPLPESEIAYAETAEFFKE